MNGHLLKPAAQYYLSVQQNLKIPSLPALAQVALVTGCGVSITGYVWNRFFEKKVRKTKTYQKAINILHNHAATIKHLGEPISEGRIKFDTSEDLRKFYVSLRGSKTSGKLNCEYIIKPDKSTEITKVEIKFNDVPNKFFVIHEI